MSVQERDYMRIEETGEGVIAASESEASELLRFACPTQAADGKWYRTTIAVSNVPVIDLYNILSNADALFAHACFDRTPIDESWLEELGLAEGETHAFPCGRFHWEWSVAWRQVAIWINGEMWPRRSFATDRPRGQLLQLLLGLGVFDGSPAKERNLLVLEQGQPRASKR